MRKTKKLEEINERLIVDFQKDKKDEIVKNKILESENKELRLAL